MHPICKLWKNDQTTTAGATFTTLYEKCMGYLTSPAYHYNNCFSVIRLPQVCTVYLHIKGIRLYVVNIVYHVIRIK